MRPLANACEIFAQGDASEHERALPRAEHAPDEERRTNAEALTALEALTTSAPGRNTAGTASTRHPSSMSPCLRRHDGGSGRRNDEVAWDRGNDPVLASV